MFIKQVVNHTAYKELNLAFKGFKAFKRPSSGLRYYDFLLLWGGAGRLISNQLLFGALYASLLYYSPPISYLLFNVQYNYSSALFLNAFSKFLVAFAVALVLL